MQENILQLLQDSIILVLTGFIGLILFLIRKTILYHLIDIYKTIRNTHHVKYNVRKDIAVQDLIAVLRRSTRADRVKIYQFYNGKTFSTQNPMWNVVCTYESVNEGIKPFSGEFPILASLINSILAPLWIEDLSNISGIERVDPLVYNCDHANCCKLPKGVSFTNVKLLSEGFPKRLYIDYGVKYCLSCGLIDDSGEVLGMISVEYCWEDASINEIKSCCQEICDTSFKIAHILTTKTIASISAPSN